jgi:hypothetical protein
MGQCKLTVETKHSINYDTFYVVEGNYGSTIQPTFLPHFPYLFTIQLGCLPYFPDLFTIQLVFLPNCPYLFTIQLTFLLYLFPVRAASGDVTSGSSTSLHLKCGFGCADILL